VHYDIDMRRIRHLAIVAFVASASPLVAQTGALVGAVLRDSAGHEIGGAEVSIPQLGRRTLSNYLGAYRMDELPPGRYLVLARFLGFSPARDTVEIVAGKEQQHEFILARQPTQLDSVRVSAAAPRRYLSPLLTGFLERRKQGFGHFMAEEELRATDDQGLANVIQAHMLGLRMVNNRSSTYLASSRHPGDSGPVLLNARQRQAAGLQQSASANQPACWLTIYIDGVRVYDATMTMRDTTLKPPDFARMSVRDYAGIEFYAGGATSPPQYTVSGTDCGTLLLWTRER
jgi:hypothetical protein